MIKKTIFTLIKIGYILYILHPINFYNWIPMDKEAAKKRIEELTEKINHYNKAYFQEATSLISDYAFDQLLKELTQLEKQFPSLKKSTSPTQRVGETLSQGFVTVKHTYPMRSLSNSYSIEEIKEFVVRTQKLLPEQRITFFAELKVDGIAVSLLYKNGRLQKMVTRGDGSQGDDITRNLHTIETLPKRLDVIQKLPYIEVRGEVFMKKSNFDKLNELYKSKNKPLLANPRNTVAGTLKTLDPSVVTDRKLNFYPYALLAHETPYPTQVACMDVLAQWGFHTLPDTSKHCQNTQDIIDYIAYWQRQKQKLDIAIDGIVVKVNSLQHQYSMGSTAKSPRWAMAYKYPPESAITLLQEVVFQVGRTGVITPVAHCEPTPLAGTIVKRASLYNITALQGLDLHIGDTVTIEKKGDIIPKITYVDKTKRRRNNRPVAFSGKCPACSTPVIQKQGLHYCANHHQCPDQLKNLLIHFSSRNALNIKHLGPNTIALLFKHNLIQKPIDLYYLESEQLKNLEGFQQKSIQNLLESINNTKKYPFHKVLFALGIPHVGKSIATKLAVHFQDIDSLMQASQEQFIDLPEIGLEIATTLIHYFKDDIYRKHINDLRSIGLAFSYPKSAKIAKDQTLYTKTFVVSGTFQSFSREAIATYIQNHGGRLVSTISSKVDYLVAGHSPGAKKMKEAKKLGTKIIGEELLRKLTNK